MVASLNGVNGAIAAKAAGRESEARPEHVTTQNQNLEAKAAKESIRKLNTAAPTPAQWMVDLVIGPCGPPAPRVVGLEATPGPGNVTTQPHKMEENLVLARKLRPPTVMCNHAQ